MSRDYFPLSAFRSRVRVWTVDDPAGGVVGENLVTYQGADIIARLLAGQANYRIARFWFEFENSSTPTTPSPGRADTAQSVRAEATAPRDIVRGMLAAQPLLSPSGPEYTGNQGTYHAITATGAAGEINSLSFEAADNSHIIAMCLVASPTGPSINDDLVYARYALGTPLAVGAAGQVAATWMTEAV